MQYESIPKSTPNRRRVPTGSAGRGRNSHQKTYASENDVASYEGDSKSMVPCTPQKSVSSAAAASKTQSTNQRQKNKGNRNRNTKNGAPSPGHRQERESPSLQSQEASAHIFAGSTFHASPAPSALPIPSFIGLPNTDSPAVKCQTGKVAQGSSPSTDSDEGSQADKPAPRHEESPLEFFFRADRAEKARVRRASSANADAVTATAFSPFTTSSVKECNTFPKTIAHNSLRRPVFTEGEVSPSFSANKPSGSSRLPVGPAFSTPYQERIRAARSEQNSAQATPIVSRNPNANSSEALKRYLFTGQLGRPEPQDLPPNSSPSRDIRQGTPHQHRSGGQQQGAYQTAPTFPRGAHSILGLGVERRMWIAWKRRLQRLDLVSGGVHPQSVPESLTTSRYDGRVSIRFGDGLCETPRRLQRPNQKREGDLGIPLSAFITSHSWVMDAHHDPFDGDEEAALRYAIALSLQDHDPAMSLSATQDPIELDSDGNEDDDLESGPKCPPTPKKTMESARGDIVKAASETSRPLPLPQAAFPGTQPSGFAALGLDRKKMEEERLARAAKRKAPHDDGTTGRQPQRIKINGQSDGVPRVTTPPASARTQLPQLLYAKGTVKKTWVSGYQRQNDIKIEEIFQKEQLELAVLSSFQWDDEWLLSKIDIKRTKMVCIAFASSEAQREEMRANVPKDRIRFCFPPMMPAGSMHSKLQLLKFSNYLRIVIPTGNLVPYDWGETGVMENMVFLIDLPMTKDPASQPTMFSQELSYFLKASGLDEGLVNSLSKYDFSETNRYRFIHTIGQSHVGEAWERTGYCGLGRAVKSLGLETQSKIELDFVVASLGSVNTDLTSAIYNAAQGDNGLKEYEQRTTGGGKKATQKNELGYHPSDFRIYFPSHETVSRSRGGKNNGGTICLQSKWWDSSTFPRELVHDCISVRPGLLMHSKILFVSHPSGSRSKASWAYLGSANLSESAWGRLVKDRVTKQPKLNCRNWECGVLIPMENEVAEFGLAAFEERIPVPMVVPTDEYGKTNSKRPWLFLEA
ncbi:hypothetical protein NUW58_g2693 [Xylaria curta]|uniref:Uncharacterized protein n=1 Tax=Xylaria curta TaxID=42375 RepID=A0ACC1PGQ8_9PEZI|nr:hypothetical protein NUW58_g2693 [Xylaria curta]